MPLFRRFYPMLFAVALVALAGCATSSSLLEQSGPADQPPLALQQLTGTWYVIAHVPYFTDRGQVAARDEYTLLPDGRVAVRYVYRTGFHAPVRTVEALATVEPGSGNRDWRMHVFRVVRATQHILEIAPDNSWALVTTPDRDLAWIFARRPEMEGKTYQRLLRKLRGYGINSDKVWRMAQTPEQVGGLGFERPNND